MTSISAISRSAFKRTLASAQASRSTLRFYTSTMHDNDPEILEREKQRNLRRQQYNTSPPIPEAPGWNEKLATVSEAAVKADHHTGNGNPEEMQEHTVAYIKSRREESVDVPNEPGVSTQSMKNGEEGSTEASYPRDEIDGPLKSAHGTVVETLEHTEDVYTRKSTA